MRHSVEPTPTAHVRTLYIYAARRDFRRHCAVLDLTPLLGAIVDHTMLAGITGDRRAAAHTRLIDVLFDQLAAARELPLFVPRLSSPIAARVAEVVAMNFSDRLRIRDLATELGVSDRTLERALVADAAMPLGEWRQRFRISRAIALLASGMDVKDVALEVGYETPSAFVASFKKYAGTTPGKFKFEAHEDS